MKAAKIIAIILAIVLISACLLIAGIVWAYLTEYGLRRIIAAIAIAGTGVLTGVIGYRLTSRFCQTKKCLVTLTLLLVLLLAPLGSMVYPKKITYARFGFTVYGLIPIPVLDITVGPHGNIWFRDKSHYVSLEEVNRLLTPEVEVVVIGIGWDSAVRVDPAIEALEGPEIYILPTPEAFDQFNRAIAEGRVAILIAHSTC